MNVVLQASQIANRGSLEFTIRRLRFGKAIVLSESVSEHGRESMVYAISACFLTFEVVHKSTTHLINASGESGSSRAGDQESSQHTAHNGQPACESFVARQTTSQFSNVDDTAATLQPPSILCFVLTSASVLSNQFDAVGAEFCVSSLSESYALSPIRLCGASGITTGNSVEVATFTS